MNFTVFISPICGMMLGAEYVPEIKLLIVDVFVLRFLVDFDPDEDYSDDNDGDKSND